MADVNARIVVDMETAQSAGRTPCTTITSSGTQ